VEQKKYISLFSLDVSGWIGPGRLDLAKVQDNPTFSAMRRPGDAEFAADDANGGSRRMPIRPAQAELVVVGYLASIQNEILTIPVEGCVSHSMATSFG